MKCWKTASVLGVRAEALIILAGYMVCLVSPGFAQADRGGWQLSLQLSSEGLSVSNNLVETFAGDPLPPLEQLKVVERKRINQRPSGDRNLSPAEGQIIVQALSQDDQILWHKMMPNPRLIRAEIFTGSGKFEEETQFVRKNVEFSIVVPDNPAIHKVQILETQASHRGLVLTTLGTIQLF